MHESTERGESRATTYARAGHEGAIAAIHRAQVLEHVHSPAAFLDEMRRILLPGGACYLTVINRNALEIVDLKRRERLARHGAVAGRLADGWVRYGAPRFTS
jgi:2-polyprenyl-3-methyl-5-hydroxy-6-metoxy-1,4-benzoquinol methylase